MNAAQTDNLNIISNQLLPTPQEIKAEIPISDLASDAVVEGRSSISNILKRSDKRLCVVLGPCAIYDIPAALDYARRLKTLADRVSETQVLVMRVYFEKPRTSTGWKGLINDPFLDDSFRIDQGLLIARKLMLDLCEMGLAVATEALDPIVPQYLSDLVSWTAIGARTTESQTHREMSSGLSTPVGFKNGTDGNVQVAINAVKAASVAHRFLGINQYGQCSVFHTRGNPLGHVVLRGGTKPNYDTASVSECESAMKKAGLVPNVMIDCSHGNSLKDHTRQPVVFSDVISQIEQGNKSIIGVMIESNIEGGRQDFNGNAAQLKYGVSITDACIDWATTEKIILEAHDRLLTSRALEKRA